MYVIKSFLYKEKNQNNIKIFTSFNFKKSFISIRFQKSGLISLKMNSFNISKIECTKNEKFLMIKNSIINENVKNGDEIKIYGKVINKNYPMKILINDINFIENNKKEKIDTHRNKKYNVNLVMSSENLNKCENGNYNGTLLYYVLAHDKNMTNIERIIKKLNDNNIDNYLLVKGNSESNYIDKENKILHLNVVDIYENLPKKMLEGIKFIFENTEYDYIYKIDDSHSFNRYPLIKNYTEYDYYGNYVVQKDIYMNNWHFGKCTDASLNSKTNLDFKNEFAAGGFGYILSRKSMEIISKCVDYEKEELFEDKLIGEILFNNNVILNENIVENKKLENERLENERLENKMLENERLENERLEKIFLYTKIVGGFGNQLFMIFNLISLSKEYNKEFQLYFDENYASQYLKDRNTIRKTAQEYELLKNLSFKKISDDKLKEFVLYNEPEYKYNKINLENGVKYNINGYFQSYKYFWDNREEIKKHLYIDNNKINEIMYKLKKYNKEIIAIHVRLGDYVKLQDYHPVPPVEYYKKALSYYNLNNYQIILFSDDANAAKEYLKELNLNFIDANELYKNDEEQFYMMCLTEVRICANSSFSLMSCYMNEMYNFKENCEYIFPHKYFGPKGPVFNIEDHMLNYKFFPIDYDNLNVEKKYDVITTLHIKDKERYFNFLRYNRKYLIEGDKFYYVSHKKYEGDSIHIGEDGYPFSKKDVIEYIKDYVPNHRWGWYYQQLLKLYIFKVKDFKYDNILIFDSDLLLLKKIIMFDNNCPMIYKRNTFSGKIHDPYIKSMKYILPEINVDENDSGICHMMIFNKNIMKNLFSSIENIHKKETWKVCLDSVINYIKQFGENLSILSEYELYYNYVKELKVYKISNDLNYIDESIKNVDFTKIEYDFIADHHYQSRKQHDYKYDNLIEEHIELIEKIGKDKYETLLDQTDNIFEKYNCNITEDRINIINNNNKINELLLKNNVKINIETSDYKNKILDESYLNNCIKTKNYDKINIYHNTKGNLKNSFLVYCDDEDVDEIILNNHNIIISNSIKKYKNVISEKDYEGDINNVEYIIYSNDSLTKNSFLEKYKNNSEKFSDFIKKKILLLQICIPNFNNHTERFKNYYNSWENKNFWIIKFDKDLCENFIITNYHKYIYFCYKLIYSVTSKTDLTRHLFLYKHGGCYFDLSVKMLNNNFISLIKDYEFITSRDEEHDLLQNGILFIKHKYSVISSKFIKEIVSGVLNEVLNENDNKSYIYKQRPSDDAFFYGPITLFKIYDDIKDSIKCKILNTYLTDKKQNKNTTNGYEFESKAIDKETGDEYLQVKYIGYYEDLERNNSNRHYSYNWRNGLNFYSTLEIVDKILIINLSHRVDRKEHIKNELNKILLSENKLVFIDAVYNEEDGAKGCTASHLKCIEYAKNNNLKNVLILEDDYMFGNDINIFNINLLKFLLLDTCWSVILLNFSEHDPPVNIKTCIDNVYKNFWSHSAAAYIVNENIYNTRYINTKKSLELNKGPFDFHWNESKLNYNWYVIKGTLGYQKESYSDIENNVVNYVSPYDNLLY